MRKALTDKTVETMKPGERRYDVWDQHCPGLGLRVSPTGAKSFCVKYRYGSGQRRLTLGKYPRISLANARKKALDALRLVDEGIDPAKRQRQSSSLVHAVVEEFIKKYAKLRNRGWKEAERILQREFVAHYGHADIRTITRTHVRELIDDVAERGAGYQANRILQHIRKLGNWCVERGILDTNPAAGLKKPAQVVARDRVLSTSELTRVISTAEAMPFPFGPYALMLVATAQRRGELANMCWSEIDFDTHLWEIPAAKCKNKKAHIVPLSPFALSVLANVPRLFQCDLVFTTTGRTGISGITKMVDRLQEQSGTSNWRLHDFRRTASSGMAEMGVAPHVVEKILNHTSGIISGVAAVYNRYGYNTEKRDALEKWGAHLERLIMAATDDRARGDEPSGVGGVSGAMERAGM